VDQRPSSGEKAWFTSRSTPSSTIACRHRPPQGDLCWSLLQPLLGGHTHAPPLSWWCPRDQAWLMVSPSIEEATKIKRSSPF
jgi:hypothetical protein